MYFLYDNKSDLNLNRNVKRVSYSCEDKISECKQRDCWRLHKTLPCRETNMKHL